MNEPNENTTAKVTLEVRPWNCEYPGGRIRLDNKETTQ